MKKTKWLFSTNLWELWCDKGEALIVFEKEDIYKTGASYGALTLYKPDGTTLKEIGFSGGIDDQGEASSSIKIGEYTINTDINESNFTITLGNNRPNSTPIDGVQYIGEPFQYRNVGGLSIAPNDWGKGRARINTEGTKEKNRHLYLHSDYNNKKYTHGCVAEYTQGGDGSYKYSTAIFDYLYNSCYAKTTINRFNISTKPKII